MNKKNSLLPKTCDEIRESFIEYFKKLGHQHVPSSSLVPASDPTLLFTNAGMVQFKDVFLGKEKRSYKRAVTCQKCLRAGGKHNDLENVGYTKRHHTFFEMLGNFSFGDYFKREAIQYAWEFLIGVLKIAPEKLWITVHHKDDEAAKIWLNEIKINPKRFSKCGDKDNFWAMGETGPCGYCSEIYYDYGDKFEGDPPSDTAKEGDRFVEIWNLVFMEFERDADGKLTRLPNPSIDTGMGLERIAAAMQEGETHGDNYEIDLFYTPWNILWNAKVVPDESYNHPSAKVLLDHARAVTFLIADGVYPDKDGRGYVLRVIIRRMMRHMKKLDLKNEDDRYIKDALKNFDSLPKNYRILFYLCVFAFPEIYSKVYPELNDENVKNKIEQYLETEVKKFAATIEAGEKFFELNAISWHRNKIIPGEAVFYLHDTLGFPISLTNDMAKEHGFIVDVEGFNREMSRQKEAARAASKFVTDDFKIVIDREVNFVGYEQNECDSKIIALYKNGATEVDQLKLNESGIVVLDFTPFYAESGGQVGDTGEIFWGDDGFFVVEDTKKYGAIHLHYGKVTKGALKKGQKVRASINQDRRQAIKLNHSSAHLLHKALREVLGAHALQRGSLVDDKRLRFDFTHFSALTFEEIKELEQIVNQQIRNNLEVITSLKTLLDAKKEGSLALFDEKYGEMVRVVKMGDFSMELCGGTHVSRTGEIGFFKIILETSIASGVRRIEAVTGENALEWVYEYINNCNEKEQQSLANNNKLAKELNALKGKMALAKGVNLADEAVIVKGVKILVAELENVDAKNLRQTVDQLKNQLQTAIILLAGIDKEAGKIQLVAGVTEDCIKQNKIKANEIIQFIAPKIDGSGGGRPDMAQGGGTKLAALKGALEETKKWLTSEKWLFDNKEVLDQVKQGIKDSFHGKTRSLGSFEKHLND